MQAPHRFAGGGLPPSLISAGAGLTGPSIGVPLGKTGSPTDFFDFEPELSLAQYRPQSTKYCGLLPSFSLPLAFYQAATFDRGEDLRQERQNQWYRRAHKALTDAALEAQGIQPNGQGGEEPQQPPPGYVPGDEALREAERARKEGAAALRVQQYFGGNQERKQQIIDWHQAMDPESKVAEWVIENESAVAPQIMEKLADNPEALQQIAEMTPRQRDRWLGALEGNITAEQNFARKMQQEMTQWDQQRRVTKAPPIIQAPRGGASPPSDIHRLASKGEDASDYVKMRQQQEKRRG